MPAGEPGERVQRLHHARPLRPPAAGPGGERHHRHLARRRAAFRPSSTYSGRARRGRRSRRRGARPRPPWTPAAGSGPARSARGAGRRGCARAARGRTRSRPAARSGSRDRPAAGLSGPGSIRSNSDFHQPGQVGVLPGGLADAVQFGPLRRRHRPRVLPQPPGHRAARSTPAAAGPRPPASRSAVVPCGLTAKS